MRNFKTGRLCAALLCALWPATAQPGAGQARQPAQTPRPTRGAGQRQPQRPVRSAELEALVAEARTGPAEFAADVLLRLVESGRVAERAWQRELLLEAFRLAGGAQQPLKRRIAPGLPYAYTREDYRARAFQLNLDTLSLRLRAVNALVKFDKLGGRALFDELPRKLPLAPLQCADALVYDVHDFYETLLKIAQETFSAEEKARAADVLFVQAYVDEMDAPAKVWPLARVISQLGDSPARLGPLLHAYSAALARLDADDRSYMADLSLTYYELSRLAAAGRAQAIAPGELLVAFRAYIVKHLRTELCADAEGDEQTSDLNRRVPARFNAMLREASADEQLPPIATDEFTPAKVGGAAKLTPYFALPAAQTLFRTAQELRFGFADEAQPDEPRTDPKRAEKLTVWLNAMADWHMRGELTDEDYFNQKCVLYQMLLEVSDADGPAGETLLGAYLNFLRQPALQQENRAGWLLHVQRLLASTRFDADSPRARLLASLKSSGDPLLRLYAATQRARPQT
jgi:hypothetical protein